MVYPNFVTNYNSREVFLFYFGTKSLNAPRKFIAYKISLRDSDAWEFSTLLTFSSVHASKGLPHLNWIFDQYLTWKYDEMFSLYTATIFLRKFLRLWTYTGSSKLPFYLIRVKLYYLADM